MSKSSVTTIDVLRHGRTTADNILRGRIDVELSEIGYEQMSQRVANYLNPKAPWHHVVTSPLKRCAKFAEDLTHQHELSLITHKGFIEIDYGDWDGRPFDEIEAEDPLLFKNVWRKPDQYNPPNGETFQQLYERINESWQQLLKEYEGKHLLLICHGGVIRALLSIIMQTPLTGMSRIDVPYACLSQIKVYHRSNDDLWPQLVFHNTP